MKGTGGSADILLLLLLLLLFLGGKGRASKLGVNAENNSLWAMAGRDGRSWGRVALL